MHRPGGGPGESQGAVCESGMLMSRAVHCESVCCVNELEWELSAPLGLCIYVLCLSGFIDAFCLFISCVHVYV